MIEVTQELHTLFADRFNSGKMQQAFVIWRALLVAAQKNFLPKKAFTAFLLQTTKTILPILDASSAFEVLRLYEDLVIDDAVESECRSDVHLFEADLRAAIKENSSHKSVIPNMIDDCPIALLRCYTSAYQCEKTEKNEKLATANKITACEKTFLTHYCIYTWQTFETFIDNQLTMPEYTQALRWLIQVMVCNEQYLQTDNKVPDWQRYRQIIQDYRMECVKALPTLPLNNEHDVDAVITAQRTFNKNIRENFLKKMIKDCFNMLGSPPCATAFLGVGSLARDELMLFSDLDLIILLSPNELEKPVVKAYFAAFLKLFEFKLQSLGESARRSEPKGFLLDDGISPGFDKTEPLRAIGSYDDIIKQFGPGTEINGMQLEKIKSGEFYSLLNTVYLDGTDEIKGCSGENLFTQYQKAIEDHLNSTFRPDLTVRQALIQQHLPQHIEEIIHKKSGPIKETSAFAIKEEHASFLFYIASNLALIFKLPIANTLKKINHTNDIWQALADAKIIDQETAGFAKRCVALAMALSIQSEYFYGQQLKPKLIALSESARETVFKWISPPGWWTFNLSAANIPDQLKSVFLNPTSENIFSINHETYLQLAASEWLLIQPLILTLKNIDFYELNQLKDYNLIQENFIELLQIALKADHAALQDFANSIKDYVHFTHHVIPICVDNVLTAIPLTTVTLEQQLLLLDLLGRYCLIENKPIALDFTPRELNTLLHKAIRGQQMGAMKLLLRSGACVDYQDDEKQNALHLFARLAFAYSADEVFTTCQLLLGYANTAMNQYDQIGYTPLLCLIDYAEVAPEMIKQLVQLFMKKGANINALNFESGDSVLDKLIIQKHVNGFEAMVCCGASQLKDIEATLKFIEENIPSERQVLVLHMLQQRNNQLAWRLSIRSITFAHAAKETQLIEGSKSGKRYLPTNLEYYEPEFGRHNVKIVKNEQQELVIKPNPELPGIEIAVTQLAHFLFGHGTPHSELFKAASPKLKPTPMIISQAIGGENLQTILMSPDWENKLAKLDATRYWEMVFFSLLVLWEDGIPSNFKWVPFNNAEGKISYHLVCVDNDHAFVQPKKLNKQGVYELQAKCILWFFSQINTKVDPTARDKFLKHNPLVFFKYWLESLNKEQQAHFELFKEKSDLNHLLFKQKENMQTAVAIPIRKHIKNVYIRFVRLQRILTKHADVDGLTLIEYVVPSIGNLVRQGFNAGKSPLERFSAMKEFITVSTGETSPGIYHTLASTTKILEMQEIPLKDMIEENNIHGPSLALQDLEKLSSEVDNLLAIKNSLINGDILPFIKIINTEMKDKILNGFSFSVFNKDKDKQKQFINILKRGGFYKLSIRDCSELSDDDLMDILKLSPELTSLSLINCQKITKKLWEYIQKYAVALKILIIEKLPNLEMPGDRNKPYVMNNIKKLIMHDCGIKDLFLEAKHLKKLELSMVNISHLNNLPKELCELSLIKCEQLESIDISAKKLEVLKIKSCPNTQRISTKSHALNTLIIFECTKMTNIGLRQIADNTFNLKEVIIKNSHEIKLSDFITRYPFLINTPIDFYHQFIEKNSNLYFEIIKIFDEQLIVLNKTNSELEKIKNNLSALLFRYLHYALTLSTLCDALGINRDLLAQNGQEMLFFCLENNNQANKNKIAEQNPIFVKSFITSLQQSKLTNFLSGDPSKFGNNFIQSLCNENVIDSLNDEAIKVAIQLLSNNKDIVDDSVVSYMKDHLNSKNNEIKLLAIQFFGNYKIHYPEIFHFILSEVQNNFILLDNKQPLIDTKKFEEVCIAALKSYAPSMKAAFTSIFCLLHFKGKLRPAIVELLQHYATYSNSFTAFEVFKGLESLLNSKDFESRVAAELLIDSISEHLSNWDHSHNGTKKTSPIHAYHLSENLQNNKTQWQTIYALNEYAAFLKATKHAADIVDQLLSAFLKLAKNPDDNKDIIKKITDTLVAFAPIAANKVGITFINFLSSINTLDVLYHPVERGITPKSGLVSSVVTVLDAYGALCAEHVVPYILTLIRKTKSLVVESARKIGDKFPNNLPSIVYDVSIHDDNFKRNVLSLLVKCAPLRHEQVLPALISFCRDDMGDRLSQAISAIVAYATKANCDIDLVSQALLRFKGILSYKGINPSLFFLHSTGLDHDTSYLILKSFAPHHADKVVPVMIKIIEESDQPELRSDAFAILNSYITSGNTFALMAYLKIKLSTSNHAFSDSLRSLSIYHLQSFSLDTKILTAYFKHHSGDLKGLLAITELLFEDEIGQDAFDLLQTTVNALLENDLLWQGLRINFNDPVQLTAGFKAMIRGETDVYLKYKTIALLSEASVEKFNAIMVALLVQNYLSIILTSGLNKFSVHKIIGIISDALQPQNFFQKSIYQSAVDEMIVSHALELNNKKHDASCNHEFTFWNKTSDAELTTIEPNKILPETTLEPS